MRTFPPVFTLVFFLNIFVIVMWPSNVQANQGPILAVFDMEDRGSGLDAGVLINLTDYLAVLMAEGGYQVVPRSQVRERIKNQQIESKKECYEQSCQVELGRELAAQKSLATQIFKIGGVCKVTATLFDLRRATTEKAASAGGSCEEKELLAAVEQIAKKLAVTADDNAGSVGGKKERALVAMAEQARVEQEAKRAAEQARVEQEAKRAAEQARVEQEAKRAAEQARVEQEAKRAAEQERGDLDIESRKTPADSENTTFDVWDNWWNLSIKLGGLMPSFSSDYVIWVQRDDGAPDDDANEEGIRNVFGVLMDIGADFKLGGYFSIGPYFVVIASEGQDDESNTGMWSYLSLGARFKGRFAVGQRLEIRPALSLGLGYIPYTDEFDIREKREIMMDFSDAMGLCLELSVEFAYYAWDSMAFLMDIGIITQPVGNASLNWPVNQSDWNFDVPTSVSASPFLFVGLGLEFGG